MASAQESVKQETTVGWDNNAHLMKSQNGSGGAQNQPSNGVKTEAKQEPSFADDTNEGNFGGGSFNAAVKEETGANNQAGENPANSSRPENSNAGNRPLEPEQFRKIFIGALPAELTDEGLKEYYAQWGEVVDCVIMRDRETRVSRRFGFIAYSTSEGVDLAMRNRPHTIMDKVVDPKRAIPKDATQDEWNFQTKRMYISGVRESHTEEMFREYFSQFGAVEKVDILTDKATGNPRGFAFVNFEDTDIVDKCVLMRSHQIGGFRCDVKKAQSKEGGGGRGGPRSFGGGGRDGRKRPAQGGSGPPPRRGQGMSAWDVQPQGAWAGGGPNQAWTGGWAPGAPPAQDYGYGGGASWADDVYNPGWGGSTSAGGGGGYGGGGYGGGGGEGWGGGKGGGGGRGRGGSSRGGGKGGRGGGGGRRGGGGGGGRH